MSPETEHRKLAAIMFTDMAGYSGLSQRKEALALELLEEHRQLLRSVFPRFNGVEIKTIGDAFLIEFASALEAARCAIEIQRILVKRNADVTAERRIEVKIGIHIGDVVHRGGDVYGDGVNIASRIEPLAGPNGICVSMDVERQIRNALEARFETLGVTELKNIRVPMELFRIVLPWEKQAGSSSVERGASERGRRRGRPLVWAAVALGLLAGLGGWFVYISGKATKQAATSPNVPTSGATAKSVAVLPFVNMSADKTDDYLSDGITEELLNALCKIRGLRVPGRSSSFAFKGEMSKDIFRKVGEQLGVTTVLEGSVRKDRNRIRITAQLINVADGFHLWSETYDRELTDILMIQSDVAQRVVEALKLQLGAEEKAALAKKPSDNPEAYHLYLLGRYFWNKRTGEGFRKAIEQFQQAIARDPNYALGYVGLADCYSLMDEYADVATSETSPKARAAADRALQLDGSLAEAHTSSAHIYELMWNWVEAEQGYRRAINLNPNYATAHHWFSIALKVRQQFDDSLREMKIAEKLDPLAPIISLNVAEAYLLKNDVTSAIEQTRKAIALDPSFPAAHSFLGLTYLRQQRFQEAIAEVQKAVELSGRSSRFLSDLGHCHAVGGQRSEALRILKELEEKYARREARGMHLAAVYGGLGEQDQAFVWLEKDFQQRTGSLRFVTFQPNYEPLRGDRRYADLVRRMGLAP